ncbi:MAG: class I SAM-dependent methyltransferase [Proteobacteria bacterium]|nr:class I SAM-dependent methyltransferase [Pseudomonadota bacterium]
MSPPGQDLRYFATARHDVLAHVAGAPARVLEIGCGQGSTLAVLKQRGGATFAVGVELDADAAAVARPLFDTLYVSTVEAAPFEEVIAPGSLDAVFCLDVLEHLVDPWAVVKRVSPLLAPGGRLYISLPNVRNWKFLARLFFLGDFRYRDSGILDRTHLRFFTRETAGQLAEAGGLKLVDSVDARTYRPYEVRRLLNFVSLGFTREWIAKQWIVIAERR